MLGGEARLDPTIGGESIEAMRSPAVLKKEKKKKKASGEEGGRTSAAVRWKAGRRGADGAGVQRGARGAGEAHAATGRVGCRRHWEGRKERERERRRRRRRSRRRNTLPDGGVPYVKPTPSKMDTMR